MHKTRTGSLEGQYCGSLPNPTVNPRNVGVSQEGEEGQEPRLSCYSAPGCRIHTLVAAVRVSGLSCGSAAESWPEGPSNVTGNLCKSIRHHTCLCIAPHLVSRRVPATLLDKRLTIPRMRLRQEPQRN